MIVRDEESNIFNCLDSVKDFADEIIVVDTGSVDNTISIVKQFTSKIYYFDWCDDFSKARNHAISKATKKYIFQLDADETFNGEIASELKDLLKSNSIVLVNTTIKEFSSKDSFFLAKSNNPRIFLNRNDIKYYRSYHEMVFDDCKKISGEENLEIVNFDKVVTNHYGYDSSIIENKWHRGIRIMSKWIEDSPNDDYILTKLSLAYVKVGEIDKASKLSYRAFKIDKSSRTTFFVFINILINQRKSKDAIKYLLENKNFVDEFYYNLLGLANFNSQNYIEAKQNFLEAINLNGNNPKSFSNLALVYAINDDDLKAIKNYEIAYSLDKRDFNILNNIGSIYLKIKNFERTAFYFNESLKLNSNQKNLFACIKANSLEKYINIPKNS